MSNPFIAKGKGIMYRAIRLTDRGRRFYAKAASDA